VTERAALWLVFEHRDRHLSDHALTSGYASMVTVKGIRQLDTHNESLWTGRSTVICGGRLATHYSARRKA